MLCSGYIHNPSPQSLSCVDFVNPAIDSSNLPFLFFQSSSVWLPQNLSKRLAVILQSSNLRFEFFCRDVTYLYSSNKTHPWNGIHVVQRSGRALASWSRCCAFDSGPSHCLVSLLVESSIDHFVAAPWNPRKIIINPKALWARFYTIEKCYYKCRWWLFNYIQFVVGPRMWFYLGTNWHSDLWHSAVYTILTWQNF
jgi:hypothetical protein